MELPVLEKSADFSTSVKINDEVFTIRPWTTKDEKRFLTEKTLVSKKKLKSEDEEQEAINKLLIDNLITPCIIDGDTDKLSFIGMKKLMLEIRSISVGEEIEGLQYKCTECERTNEFSINLDEPGLVQYKECPNTLFEIDDKIKVRLKSIPFKKVRKDFDEIDILYNTIDEIVIEGKSYREFTKENFNDFLDSMNIKTYKNLINVIHDNSESLTIKTTRTCMFCGSETELEFEDMPDFFIP